MTLDTALALTDWSPATLAMLCDRIEKSRTLEQLTYRESEIDEVWRLVDCNLTQPDIGAATKSRLLAVKSVIWEVHELLGHDENPKQAAARLRDLLG